jgi:hypothetical protein
MPRGKIPPPPTDDGKHRLAPGEWWEWPAIFFAIAALWPKILRWEHIGWDFVLWGALALMLIVLRRRMRRMRESWKRD